MTKYMRPYAGWIALGIGCSAAEAIFELLIPLVMSDIVDVGIATGDQGYILRKGILMVVMAMVSLAFGLGAAACSATAGMGFGAGLRAAEYDHIQEYAFSNIEKFSTASLVTRLTNDVNNLQMTLMFGMRLLVRAPVMLVCALFLSIRISRQLSNRNTGIGADIVDKTIHLHIIGNANHRRTAQRSKNQRMQAHTNHHPHGTQHPDQIFYRILIMASMRRRMHILNHPSCSLDIFRQLDRQKYR